MKQTIRIIDKRTGKVFQKEHTLRNLDHFEVQRRTRAHVFVDRRFKKPRHKKSYDEE